MTSIAVDAYVVDTLMADLIGHDRLPSAFCVYLLLWRHTHGIGEPSVQVRLYDLATGTGLSKPAVQGAPRRPSQPQLLCIRRKGIRAIPVSTVGRPWIRP